MFTQDESKLSFCSVTKMLIKVVAYVNVQAML